MTTHFLFFMSSNFGNYCQKRPNFLSQSNKKFWHHTFCFFLSLVSDNPVKKDRISYHNDSNKKFWHYTLCLHVFKFQKILSKKTEFLITMRAIKSFDTILFVSSCLQMKSNQKFWHHNFCVLKFHKIVSKKGRIAYHNESNKKFWHHIFCVFMSSNLRKLCQKRMNFLSQWEQ